MPLPKFESSKGPVRIVQFFAHRIRRRQARWDVKIPVKREQNSRFKLINGPKAVNAFSINNDKSAIWTGFRSSFLDKDE